MIQWTNFWDVLGLKPGSDRVQIRRAYAKKLRDVHPEDDPEGFQRLRSAYEAALRFAPMAVAPVGGDAGKPSPNAEPATEPPHQEEKPREIYPEDDRLDAPRKAAPTAGSDAGAPSPDAEPATEPPHQEEKPRETYPEDDRLDSPRKAAPAADTDAGKPSPGIRRPLDHLFLTDDPPADPAGQEGFSFEAARNRLQHDMARLAAALANGDAGEDERLAALDAVLRSPLLDHLASGADIEKQIARLLVRHLPRSDYALERAIAHFHWDTAHRWQEPPAEIRPIHRRIAEWRFMQELADPDHPCHAGWRLLTGGSAPRGWLIFKRAELARQVAAIRERARTDLPGIAWSFDERALAYCDRRLTGPQLSINVCAAVLAILAMSAFTLMSFIVSGRLSDRLAATLVIAGLLATPWALSHGALWLRKRIERVEQYGRGWIVRGWLPAVLTLPFLALLWPPYLWPMVVVGIAALAINIWIRATSIWFPAPQTQKSLVEILKDRWYLLAFIAIGIHSIHGQFLLTFLFSALTALSLWETSRLGIIGIFNEKLPYGTYSATIRLGTWAALPFMTLLSFCIGGLPILIRNAWLMPIMAMMTFPILFALAPGRLKKFYTLLDLYIVIIVFFINTAIISSYTDNPSPDNAALLSSGASSASGQDAQPGTVYVRPPAPDPPFLLPLSPAGNRLPATPSPAETPPPNGPISDDPPRPNGSPSPHP